MVRILYSRKLFVLILQLFDNFHVILLVGFVTFVEEAVNGQLLFLKKKLEKEKRFIKAVFQNRNRWF